MAPRVIPGGPIRVDADARTAARLAENRCENGRTGPGRLAILDDPVHGSANILSVRQKLLERFDRKHARKIVEKPVMEVLRMDVLDEGADSYRHDIPKPRYVIVGSNRLLRARAITRSET